MLLKIVQTSNKAHLKAGFVKTFPRTNQLIINTVSVIQPASN